MAAGGATSGTLAGADVRIGREAPNGAFVRRSNEISFSITVSELSF